MTNAVQGILIEAQRQPAQHEVAGGKVESAAEELPSESVPPRRYGPVTLKDAWRHRYAVWKKSNGYPYQEGYCMVAVPKGTLAFQCSYRIDPRGRSRNPLCREHQAEYTRRTP